MKKLLLRGLLLVGGLLSTGVLLEIGLTLHYVGFGARGPFEVVEEFGSPFVFRGSYDGGNAFGIRPQAREVSPQPNDVADEARTRTRGRDSDGQPLAIHSHRYMLGWDGFLLAPLAVRGSPPLPRAPRHPPSIHVYRDDQYSDASRELVRRAEARATELGLPYVSLVDALGSAGGSDLFMDFCHPTPRGHRAIGSLLVRSLEQW